MYCLETENVTHQYSSRQTVLKNISLQISEGSIYGFLGPNGAGKTTTLRLVLGLLKLQQGTISVFDEPFQPNRVGILKKIGSLIESPSLYGHLTARENLRVLQKIYQCPAKNIQEVLEMVGLAATGSKKASQFSLGMKQRLSIAIALLHHPSLLILDEPTNGLDPNGMIEIRELLQKLNQENGTSIVISSHLLAEIEKLVTHVGIINKGQLMFQGTLDALKSKQQQVLSVVLETNDRVKTIQILAEHNIVAQCDEEKILLPALSNQMIARVNAQLVAKGIEVYAIQKVNNDLEAIFMDIINH